MDRPALPRQLERDVLVEAGHRCAIPTCKQTPVEIAHIEPYRDVQSHTFDNLIALCPTCHTRYDREDIDRKAMRQYKANLCILNSRYGDLEKRLLFLFAQNPNEESISLMKGLDIFLMYLLADDLIVKDFRGNDDMKAYMRGDDTYYITEKGKSFIEKWLAGNELD